MTRAKPKPRTKAEIAQAQMGRRRSTSKIVEAAILDRFGASKYSSQTKQPYTYYVRLPFVRRYLRLAGSIQGLRAESHRIVAGYDVVDQLPRYFKFRLKQIGDEAKILKDELDAMDEVMAQFFKAEEFWVFRRHFLEGAKPDDLAREMYLSRRSIADRIRDVKIKLLVMSEAYEKGEFEVSFGLTPVVGPRQGLQNRQLVEPIKEHLGRDDVDPEETNWVKN